MNYTNTIQAIHITIKKIYIIYLRLREQTVFFALHKPSYPSSSGYLNGVSPKLKRISAFYKPQSYYWL